MTQNTEATCYFCKATDQPMVYTKKHGWKCRSAKACVARWQAARKVAA